MRRQDRREFLGTSAKVTCGALALGAVCPLSAAEKTKAKPDSYCGLYCGGCKNLQTSSKATDPAKVKCLGCKSDKTAGWCAKCDIKTCAKEMDVDSCGECDMFPCEKLTKFQNNGKDYRILAEKNCKTIQAKGHKQWLKDQKERWACPKCKATFSWNDEKCPKCGADVLSCKEEATAYRAKRDK
ncbi:MAG: DUF3795 domain-containing protein [Victivallales bacterium]|nr:DUF3795 domain-containing protein [Victivallales bacterium]